MIPSASSSAGPSAAPRVLRWLFDRRAALTRRGTLHLVCAADATYASWLGVMFASVFRFGHGLLHIHLLSDGIDAPTLQCLSEMVAAAGAGLSVCDLTPHLDAEPVLPVFAHVSRATYARVIGLDLLPAAVDRVLYLDVDLLCRASLRRLWSCDLGDNVAGAVPDCAVGSGAPAALAAQARRTRDLHAAHVGLPPDGTYINSGVLLIDLVRWRRERVGAAVVAWLRANNRLQQFGDQDALNCVLRGRLAMLDENWNQLARWSAQEAHAGAKILHFAGPEKPWHANYSGAGLAEWLAVRAGSPFDGGARLSVMPRPSKKP